MTCVVHLIWTLSAEGQVVSGIKKQLASLLPLRSSSTLSTSLFVGSFIIQGLRVRLLSDGWEGLKSRYSRGGLLLKYAPETRFRVSTPTSTHKGLEEGAKWLNNPIGAWELKKQANLIGQLEKRHVTTSKFQMVHTRELAPETDSCNRFAPGACSLISNQFDMREQNSGTKVLLRNVFFR